MASKYNYETRERVVRIFRERLGEAPEESATASFRRVHELSGIPARLLERLEHIELVSSLHDAGDGQHLRVHMKRRRGTG